MPFDSPRIAELRRRVLADPASIAFAQLAEEYRRAGEFHEAVRVCRVGLARHPSYLSARVTLGRALIALGQLDEAEAELDIVLRAAPDNLAAIRGRAEIHQGRGQLEPALDFYKRALDLAQTDPALERTVKAIGLELEQATAPAPEPEPPPAVPAGSQPAEPAPPPPFDFDDLFAALGGDATAGEPEADPRPVGRTSPAAGRIDPDLDRLAEEADA
ncbi:MAG: tetratricopeptide repeat protein, partial [Vicinamibacterales bacterium]